MESNNVNTDVAQTPETNATPSAEPAEQKPADNKPDNGVEKKEPSPQELLLEVTRLKRANDKLSHENAEARRNLQARMTEQEKLDQEKAEAEAAKDERLKELEKAAKVHEYADMFMDLGYSKDDARKAATAQVDGDMETLVAIQKSVLQNKIDEVTKQKDDEYKAKEAEWLKSRPDPAQGGGDDDPFLKGFNSVPIRR